MSQLCYADGKAGVHLTRDGRRTLCGGKVYDIPQVPRQVGVLSCRECYLEESRDR